MQLGQSKRIRGLFGASVILFVICLSLLVKASFLRNVDNPVGFQGPFAYAIDYVVEHGTLLKEGDVDAPTSHSRGVFYGDSSMLAMILPAELTMISGDFFGLQSRLLISLFMNLGFAFALASISIRLLSRFSFTVYPESIVPTIVLLGVGNVGVLTLLDGRHYGGFEIIVILLCIGMMLVGRPNGLRAIPLIILSFFLPVFHFTAGLIFTVFLMGFLAHRYFSNRFDRHHRTESEGDNIELRWLWQFSSVYLVFYIGYTLVFAPSSFGPFRTFLYYFSELGGGITRSDFLDTVLADFDPLFFVLNALSITLVVAPIVFSLIFIIMRRDGRADIVSLTLWSFLPLALLSAGMYVWMGLLGVIQRMSIYVVYFASIVIPIGIGRKFSAFLIVFALISIPVALYIYTQSPYNRGSYAIPEEEAATDWMSANLRQEDMIFSDLRLSGLLIGKDHLYVVGISDSGGDVEWVPIILDCLFYNPDGESIRSGIEQVAKSAGIENVDFILISSAMSVSYPSISGYDYTYQPAIVSLCGVYSEMDFLSLVCDSGSAYVFEYLQ